VLAAGAPTRTAAPTLAIEREDRWSAWWRADHAPERWVAADPRVTRALAWRRLADGIEWSTARLAGSAPAWRTRLIVVRIDPRRVRFELALDLTDRSGRPAWTIDRAPPEALVAVNAGQFVGSMPWGWVVMEGFQRLRPGIGPLSSAVALDTSGTVRWIAGDSLRLPANGVRTAFQSYPTLLRDDGAVPAALRTSGSGVDLGHRDGRLAIGQTRDGRMLLVMTRFAALGELAERLPLGPTTPEMAAVMGALGARDAVMLDGGISAQLLLREPASGRRWRWPGWRKVPMALVVYSR
jgi:phosphodiester glycosidase